MTANRIDKKDFEIDYSEVDRMIAAGRRERSKAVIASFGALWPSMPHLLDLNAIVRRAGHAISGVKTAPKT